MIVACRPIRIGPVALVIALFAGTAAESMASLELPELPQFELAVGGPASSGGAGDASTEQDGRRPEMPQTPVLAEHALPLGGSSTSTTTTSAGGGSTAPVATLLGDALSLTLIDPAVTGWVSGENRLVLPSPPGNSLLRPPQS